jgi:hypothetical protein
MSLVGLAGLPRPLMVLSHARTHFLRDLAGGSNNVTMRMAVPPGLDRDVIELLLEVPADAGPLALGWIGSQDAQTGELQWVLRENVRRADNPLEVQLQVHVGRFAQVLVAPCVLSGGSQDDHDRVLLFWHNMKPCADSAYRPEWMDQEGWQRVL